MAAKYIFVTGGVISGLGKGIAAASIGNLLKRRHYKVFMQKFDPYLNVDAGTLNPAEHGECFVTADGAECDLDLGHYERFLDIELNRYSSVMSGQIYQSVIKKERQGRYLGKTIQVIPHVTDEIKHRLYGAAESSKCDILITEVGGTVGDIEGRHFIEAIRQVAWEKGKENVFYAHVAYIPFLESSQELKTKPVQNSLNDLRALGIVPDLVFCRAERAIRKDQLRKIALFGGLKQEAVVPLPTARSIYEVPVTLENFQVDLLIAKSLHLQLKHKISSEWMSLVRRIQRKRDKKIVIGLVGKYTSMTDTYFSVTEALKAAAWQTGYNLEIKWIDGEEIEENGTNELKNVHGVVAPGGFGSRGIEGIIAAIKYAREHHIPYLGLCLGMQLACVEFARNVLKLKKANSTEFDHETPHPVIDFMPDQKDKIKEGNYGATMRLGNFPCRIAKYSQAHKMYRTELILERHRHRYEFNNDYRERFLASGFFEFTGISPDNTLIEMIELSNHPYFLACQFHPEFRSRPTRPHPLFVGLIKNAIIYHQNGPAMV